MECVCVYRGTEEQGLRVSWWCSVCVYLFIGELFGGVLWCVCVYKGTDWEYFMVCVCLQGD